MKPRSPIKRGKRPKPFSEKRRGEQDRRSEVVRLVTERDRVCQAGALVSLAQVPHGGGLAVHELIPRAQWAKGYLDPLNCLLICADHHRFVHNHPLTAHALGLLRWSYERPPDRSEIRGT